MPPSARRPATRTTRETATRSVSSDETLELIERDWLGEEPDVGKLERFLYERVRLGMSSQVNDPTCKVVLFKPAVDIDPRRSISSEVDVEHGQALRERWQPSYLLHRVRHDARRYTKHCEILAQCLAEVWVVVD